MPEAEESQQVGAGPPTPPPSIAPPSEPPSDQGPPANAAGDNPNNDKKEATELKEIARGESWLIGVGILGVFVNAILGWIYYQQLGQMQLATQASTEATRIASESLTYSASQFDRTMVQATSQSASQFRQAEQAVVAANAAKKAADVASNSLIISERAFIAVPAPRIDTTEKTVYVPIVNYGRIPSGPVVIENHSAIFSSKPGETKIGPSNVVSSGWNRQTIGTIVPGEPPHSQIANQVAQMSKDRLMSANDVIVVAGDIFYNDGFPDTPRRHATYCWKTAALKVAATVVEVSCDTEPTLEMIKKIDGYPSSPQK